MSRFASARVIKCTIIIDLPLYTLWWFTHPGGTYDKANQIKNNLTTKQIQTFNCSKCQSTQLSKR